MSHSARRRRLAAARLYAITSDAAPDHILRVVPALLAGGAGLIQLRHKALARGELLELALELAPLVRSAGALFVVNDHLDIALLAGADGVHLGPDDLPPAAARRLAGPSLLIGASAGSVAAAQEAEAAGADYLGSGPAFPTPVKPGKEVIGPRGVAEVQAAVRIPVFAIGGIEASNLSRLRAAGVHRFCAIRALFDAANPELAARRLLEEAG